MTPRLVKVVYSYISDKKIIHTSLTGGDFQVEYIPQVWTYPILKNSLLFVYNSLRTALGYHPAPQYDTLPFVGKTYWYAETIEAKRIWPLKDPPDDMKEYFWKLYLSGWRYERWSEGFSWKYVYRDCPDGILAAKRVRLVQLVSSDEIEEHQVKIDIAS